MRAVSSRRVPQPATPGGYPPNAYPPNGYPPIAYGLNTSAGNESIAQLIKQNQAVIEWLLQSHKLLSGEFS